MRSLAWFAVLAVVLAGCAGRGVASPPPRNGPFEQSIEAGLSPALTPDDAVAITWDYLARQTPEIAAPELHVPPHVSAVWAVRASDARALDGCIPQEESGQVVWVTTGTGDYLNLHDLAWSRSEMPTDDPTVIACQGPGAAGVLVIDDATRTILGVFPLISPAYPHPTGDGPGLTFGVAG